MRFCVFALVLSIATCMADEELPWWKTAVFYQVYPRSFKDSDGDGIGDLKGITQVADYFKDIGVDAIWLSPIYPSPMADFGYDISDFTGIDPVFGTMDDFDELLAKMREIDIKLVLDFVPNHSSDEHEWFKKSVNTSDPEHYDYKDFYVWKDPKGYNNTTPIPPNNWISGFSGPAWEWKMERKQFYLHKFAKQQPDLNYTNPNVLSNMTAVINFWLDKGVDGFRMDAVQQLVEDDKFPDEPPVPGTAGNTYNTLQHIYEMNLPGTFDILQYWAKVVYERVQSDGRQRAIFLEVYDNISTSMKYYGRGNESLEFPFNFFLLTHGDRSARPADLKQLIDNWMDAMPAGGVANWVVGNHDNGRVADRYGFEFVDSINMLTMFLPGIKVTYNGEEIGMQNTFIRWEQTVDPQGKLLGKDHYLEATRDPERTPFQWDSSVCGGFSSNDSSWLPVNPNYWWLNVQAQLSAEASHLKVYKAMAQARKDPVLQKGKLNVTAADNDTLLVTRSYNGLYFVLIINMGSEVLTYTSQSLFAPNNLDMDMVVVVGSINSGYEAGTTQQKGSQNLSLRPKAAVLLSSSASPRSITTNTAQPESTTSKTSPNSSFCGSPHLATTLLAALLLLFFSISQSHSV